MEKKQVRLRSFRRYFRYCRDNTAPVPRSTYYGRKRREKEQNQKEEYINTDTRDDPTTPTDEETNGLCTAEIPVESTDESVLENENPSDNERETDSDSDGSESIECNLDSNAEEECVDGYVTNAFDWTGKNSAYFAPLYDGSTMTVCGAYCCIMEFAYRFKLSYKATEALISLLELFCPFPNKLPRSLYKLKKFFKQFNTEYKHETICSTCGSIIEKVCTACSNAEQPCHLVHLPIVKSLQTVITRNLDYLTPHNADMDFTKINDIWTGSVLQSEINSNTLFHNKYSIAVSIYTDGIPLYKSNCVSLWPVLLTVLNLPPVIRQQAHNIIMCGLWYGSKKPDPDMLIGPVAESLSELALNGLMINSVSESIKCHVKLMFGVFDLIARALMLKCKQFNGEYGCSVCLHPGKRLSNGCRIYLPCEYPQRTHDSIISDGRAAETGSASVINGIFGVSPLHTILNLVDGVPVDYMHCVLEGLVKRLLSLWFDSSHHNEPYYLGRCIALIDANLKGQHPPSEFSRSPRSIQKHVKLWKASEFKSWLLYYSLPLLLGNLPSLFFHHFALLSCSMHILLQESITTTEIDAAEHMIKDFVILLHEIYGEHNCTANSHMLLHLPKYVRLWGPLWTHSAFALESKNGKLKQLFHGNNMIHQQLIDNIEYSQTIQLIHQVLTEHESPPMVEFIYSNKNHSHGAVCISPHTYFLGNAKLRTPTTEESNALGSTDHIIIYKKLLKDGTAYSCTSIGSKKRDDTVCSFRLNNIVQFGQISSFVYATPPQVLLHIFEVTSILQQAGPTCRESMDVYKEVDMLLKCRIMAKVEHKSNNLFAIPVFDLLSKAIIISNGTHKYVARLANCFEHN